MQEISFKVINAEGKKAVETLEGRNDVGVQV